jgi:CheY-like chemotaxis protein
LEGQRGKGGQKTIQVCFYKGCGVVYGEKEPLSDKSVTHGLCPKHLKLYLKEIKAEVARLRNNTQHFKVLIVEDSALFRESFTSWLLNRFPTVEFHGAGDGEEALQKVETLHPSLIFMDIRLPGESGLELTRKIKTSYPDILIIILTSYDLPEYREAAARYKADYFFSKGSLGTENIFKLVESILPSRGHE